MQHTLICPPLNPSEVEGNPAFSVLIAYEDFDTGKLAKRTYDFLVENLGRDCNFVNQMWKFDVLSIPNLRQIAVDDATGADIIIISCHGDELPEHVKLWIESWLERALNPLALVALFDRSPDSKRESSAVRSYLSGVARRGRMEFFAQPEKKSRAGAVEHQVSSSEGAGLTQRALSTLAGVVQQDVVVPRWGINE